MPSILRLSGPLLLLLALLPLEVSAQGGEEFDWIGQPPDRMYPGQLESVGARATAPDESGTLRGYPFCSAPSGVMCDWDEGEFEGYYPTSALQEDSLYFDVDIGGSASTGQTLTVTMGVIFEDGDGIQVDSISRDLDVDIRDEYAWAMDQGEDPESDERGSTGKTAKFRVDKVGAAATDSVSFTCTVIAYPAALGLADESCTPPAGYRVNALSSIDTVEVTGITVHEHGDSVRVKLTATSEDDPGSFSVDEYHRITLTGPDYWVQSNPFTTGPGAVIEGPDYELLEIPVYVIGEDALTTCAASSGTCKISAPGEEMPATSVVLAEGTYAADIEIGVIVSGTTLSEGPDSLTLTLDWDGESGYDVNEKLYFTVWDPTPVVTYLAPPSDTEIEAGEQATVMFTVEDPVVANGDLYNLNATWGGSSDGVELSVASVTLNDTAPDTVTVTLTGPPDGRTGVVQLTATRFGGGAESDSDQSTSITGNVLVPGATITPLEDSVAIDVDSTTLVKFEVEITGTDDTADVELVQCGVSVLQCSGTPSTIYLEDGVPDTVAVSVTRTDAGDEPVVLRISSTIHAGYDVRDTTVVTAVDPQPNLASLVAVNPGDRFDRGACLSAAAGAIAIQCDDAVFSYVVPSVRTMGQDWPLALHYNSATAVSEIAAAVEIRPQDSIPDGGYEITLQLDGAMPTTLAVDTVSLGDTSLTDRYRALIAYRDSAGAIGTSLHPIVVEVRHTGPSSSTFITLRDTIAVVDRSTAPLGAGWSMSTDERIVEHDSIADLLWVGADGSYRIYAADTLGLPEDTTLVWRSPEPFLGDSIMESGGDRFMRYLRGGGTVEYYPDGALYQVTSASGRVTTFDASGVGVPGFGGTSVTGYTFKTTSQLDSIITAEHRPSATTLTYSTGALSKITTGDGLDVDFTYSDGLLSTITDAAGVTTTITYEGSAGDPVRKVDQVALSATGEPTATIDYTASYSMGQVTAPIVDSLKATVDGPRSSPSDVSEFWITGWGGVRKTLNPVGYTTAVDFGQPELDPRRVTWMQDELGLVTTMVYDTSGRLDSLTVDGSSTTYDWNTTWETPSKITGPTGDFVQYVFDGTTGLVTTIRYGNGSVQSQYDQDVDYLTADATLIEKVTDAEGVYQQFAYDSNGNIDSIFDPVGLRSVTDMDDLGRVSQVMTVVDSITNKYTTRTFDDVGRVLTEVMTSERSSSFVNDSILVSYNYDSVGRPDTLQRTVFPAVDTTGASGVTNAAGYQTLTTSWTYDGFGRLASKTEGAGQTAETYDYDVAGNLIEIGTPNGHTITMVYDAIGRMTERVVPSVSHALDSLPDRSTLTPLSPILPDTLENCRNQCTFPFYPNSGTSYVVETDTSTFEYEEAGLTRAVNADAEVRRTYDSRGRLQTDSLHVRGWSKSASGLADTREWIEYGTAYEYDALDRVDKLIYPSQVDADDLNSFIALSYNSTTSALASVLERDSTLLEFHYDDALRLDSMSVGGAAVHAATYNNQGRIATRTATGVSETRSYTTSGQLISAGDSSDVVYTATGRVDQVEHARSQVGLTDEEFIFDPLGNVRWHKVEIPDTILPTGDRYYDELGRLVQIHRDTTDNYFGGAATVVGGRFPESLLQWYDDEGNVTWQEFEQAVSVVDRSVGADTVKWVHPNRHTISRNFHDALGQLRARQRSVLTYSADPTEGEQPADTTWEYNHSLEGAWEEFIYDPLGRRVAVRNKARNHAEGTSGPMALSFDGSTRLEAPANDHVGMGPIRKMTWAFWVDPDGDTSTNLMFVGGGSLGTSPWWIRFNYISGELKIEMIMDRPEGGASAIIRFGDLATDDWSFVVMEYDGTQPTAADRFAAYVDGEEVSWTLAATAENPGEAITQAKQALRVGADFDGKLGEILVVQDAISDSTTVADWYANGIDFDQEKLVAGYTWDGAATQDSDSVSLADVSTLGNDLAMANGSFPQPPDTTSDYASRNDGGYFDFGGSAALARLNRLHHELIAMDSPDILTWSFWLDPDGTKSEMDVMGVSRGAGSDPIWKISTVDNATRLRLDLYNDSTDAMSSTYFDGLEPDSMQFVTIEFRGNYPTPSTRTRAWADDSQLTKDSTAVTNVPSRLATEGDTTRFEVGGFATDTLSRFFEGELGELAVTSKVLSAAARGDWHTNGIAPLNTGTEPDTVYGVVKHYTWHDELTDQSPMATDLSVAEGSISYVTSTYATHHEATADSTPGICETTTTCLNAATYYVWAGSQIIVEDKRRLDYSEGDSTYFGIVNYTHTRGIDRPTSVWKQHEGGQVCAFLPSFDWRGRFVDEDRAELPWNAYCSLSANEPVYTGADRRIFSDGEDVEISSLIWHGSLLDDQHDETGLIYRRARYYDPITGLFTQVDPIGLAGGLNLYGYANGDPVNFRDPSGLCPEWLTGRPCGGVAATVLGLIPGIGDAADLGTLASGEDPFTGESVGGGGRFFAALGVISPLSGKTISAGVDGISAGVARSRRALRLGRQGEDAVRSAYYLGNKGPIEINGRIRIPDGITATTISEVKNVGYLSYTAQIRDMLDYALNFGYEFVLYVRPSTRLSRRIHDLVADGVIEIRFIPGAN